MIRVLIAEDEANLGRILGQFMTARGFAVTMVQNGRAALERLRADRFDVALLDVVMPEMDGLEVLRQLRETPLPPEVIIITGNGTIETALGALKLGAYDFLAKPYRMAEIEALVRRAWEKRVLTRNNAALVARLERADPVPHFDTQFAPLRAVLAMVEQVAATDTPLLVTGEAGTGKQTLARHLHARSARAAEPFVRVDCTLGDDELTDALLGSTHGSSPAGLADIASAGTLYLDRVDALSRGMQRLVRTAMLDGRAVTPDGSRRLVLNARVVASTTRTDAELDDALEPEFRRLLSTARVDLPPLRDRLVDLPLLAERLLERRSDGVPRRLSPAAITALEQYAWPGNLSELRAVLERSTMRTRETLLEPAHLGLDGDGGSTAADGTTLTLEELERRHIARVLELTAWHQGKAAEQLGISPKTLYRKIREYGFRRPRNRAE